MRRGTCLVALFSLILLVVLPAHAERRIALVIGNGAYKAAPLKNPVNDARDMAKTLKEMGFEVILKLNVGHRDMEEVIREFGATLRQGGLGLFYYAGHGIQLGGENYLIPVDTKIEAEADVKFGAVNAGLVLARMEDAGNGLNIVILDACRNNPFGRGFRSFEPGLARMDAPKGSLVAYATAPGKVAADGDGRNGVFTACLLKHMRTAGLKVEEVLKHVRADVAQITADKQIPWESSSLIGNFFFTSPQDYSPSQASPNHLSSFAPAKIHKPDGSKPQQDTVTPPVSGASGLKDTTEAQRLFEKAVEAYKKKDYIEALKLGRMAAEKGHVAAQYHLGSHYYKGEIVERNCNEAIKYLRISADSGHNMAQLRLGLCYLKGECIQQDYNNAKKYFLLSASQGIIEAQYNLGVIYYKGYGVEQDYDEAFKWFKISAEHGLPAAQNYLGVMYRNGYGIKKNDIYAYMWYKIAAAGGDDNAKKNLDAMSRQMPAYQISLGQRLASEWKPKLDD
jgi:TPR repeat protein